jgi:hypothetical protein
MKRLILILVGVLALVLLVQLARVPTLGHLEELAGGGLINDEAPVKASVGITIKAPPEKVWGLLTGVRNWPGWQTDISEAHFTGPVGVGREFTWVTGGAKIHSKFALVQPVGELAWTGWALQAKAVHVWKLERLADGGTKVETNESMDGLLIGLFFSSEKLQENDQRWLESLKTAAER